MCFLHTPQCISSITSKRLHFFRASLIYPPCVFSKCLLHSHLHYAASSQCVSSSTTMFYFMLHHAPLPPSCVSPTLTIHPNLLNVSPLPPQCVFTFYPSTMHLYFFHVSPLPPKCIFSMCLVHLHNLSSLCVSFTSSV